MRSAYDERLLSGEEELTKRAGHARAWRTFGVERLGRGVRAPNDVADHGELCVRAHMRAIPSRVKRDAKVAKHGPHGRVERRIGPGDAVSRFKEESRERTHSCAANAQEMHVHGGTLVQALRAGNFGVRARARMTTDAR